MRTALKNLIVLSASSILAVWCCGCHDHERLVNSDSIVGSGNIVAETRTPGTFSGIRVTGMAKVFISQDTVESLRIEADDNIIDLVTTSVDQDVLLIGLREGSYSDITVNVYATMRSVALIEFTGSGSCVTTSPIQSDDITCRITGTGTIALSGTAIRQTIVIAGAGNVQNFGLVSAQCSASILGTGNIEVNVTQQLDAIIAGVGTITYEGNPSVVHQTTTGVGSIQLRQ